MFDLERYIRNIPDFPIKGIQFKDITTILKEGEVFKRTVDLLHEKFSNEKIDKIVAVEARGFIFGAALAYKLKVGFIPVRKPGKLPAEVAKEEYDLEYGKDSIEIHRDGIKEGEKVLIVDDLLATGGTAAACCKLVEKLGAKIIGVSFLIELTDLKGRESLKNYNIQSLIIYPC